MKKKHSLRGILACLFLFYSLINYSQSIGNIAFIGFNTDGDKDFAIVALADISPNSIIYFTDDETTGVGSPSALVGSEGTITWNTGATIIKAGTVVVFSDIDSDTNTSFGASIGSISRDGAFNISGSRDGIIAFTGTNANTPTTYLAAIQIGNDNTFLGAFDGDGITLTNTGLVIGSTIVVIDNVASPDGGKYTGSRSSQLSFADYKALITDENSNWTTVSSTGDGETLLPFSQEAFTTNTTVWTGASSSVWNLAGNWDNGIPTSSSLVSIPNVATSPIISSGTTAVAGNVTIAASELLTINDANALTVNGNLTITGDLTVNTGGSLIVKGTSTGNLKYIRSIATTDKWYLVSSPVVGETSLDILNNSVSIPQGGVGGVQFAIGTYSDGWSYNYSGTWGSGNGYTVKTSAAGDLVFSGTMPTDDYALTVFDTTEDYSLYGNPYPSYIPANTNADATNNILTINTTTGQDELAESTIWFWNQASTSYITVNQASDARFIAPSQGFFVKTKGGAGDAKFDFKENMQSHQAVEVFNKNNGNSRPKIKLFSTSDGVIKSSDIFYITGTTKSFDNGYDSSMFSGVDNSYSIYTGLVANNNGKKLAIQSLPDNDYENIIIPIGLNADSGKKITFSINHQNLPSDLMVFLEDKEKKTITRLDENNSNYKITLDADSNDIGRFYLRTSTKDLRKTLDAGSFNLNQVSMYLSSDCNLRITGLQSDSAILTIFNVLGNVVFHQSLKSSSRVDVTLSNSIKQGIYIVKLETDKGNINKKIFLK